MARTSLRRRQLGQDPRDLQAKLSEHDVVLDKLDQPLIADDSGTRIHVTWRNGALYDSTGTPWSQVGRVTQVPAAGGLPAGARAFNGTNYYRTTFPGDPADQASFVGVAILAPTAADLLATTMVLSNGFSTPTNGYEVVANELGTVRFISNGECTDSPLIAGQPNIICFGADASIGRQYFKVNGRPIVINAGVITPLASFPLKVGTHFDDTLGFAGTMYEIYFSTALPGGPAAAFYGPELWDEYFADITKRAFARMGTLIVSATQIVFQATCNVHVATDNQQMEIVATAGTAFAIAAPAGAGVRPGNRLTLRIKNTSGGALGAVTWNAAFKMAAWTSPATGNSRSISFVYNGTNWIEAARTPADVPN